MKAQLGHEQVFNIIVKLIIPLLIVFGFIFSLIWIAHSGFQELKKEAMKTRVEKDVEELKEFLDNFCKKEGDSWICDTFQASILIGKIIKSIWLNCIACDCCDKGLPSPINPQLTRFFYYNPVTLDFTDCSNYGLKDTCYSDSILNEWTVTAWGIKMDSDSLCERKEFGNENCGKICNKNDFGKQELDYSCEDIEEMSCNQFCGGEDKIKWNAGIITAGESLESLEFGWYKGSIQVKRKFWSKPICDYFEAGKCKLEICPIGFDETDNSEVLYGYYEASRDTRAVWICDDPSNCEKNMKFSYSWTTSKSSNELKEDEILMTIRAIQKNARHNLDVGYVLRIKNEKECRLLFCNYVWEGYYACSKRVLDCATELIQKMRLPERRDRDLPIYKAKIELEYCGERCKCES